MTTRTMGGWLRTAILGGGVCLLPAATALADPAATALTDNGPDHAQAEARKGAGTGVPAAERTAGTPDHQQAEARGASGVVVPEGEQQAGVPDHATVESRGAAPQK
jgi:hypothetical protein